jgi:hypothetical protein
MGERAMRPFWIHQLVEYIVGLALIAQGMQDPDPLVPTLAGVVVLVNAAAVRGPMGAFRFIGRAAHRWLDVFVGGAIAFAAVQPWAEVELTGRALMLIMLLPLGFLWFYTDWEERPGRKQRRAERATGRGDDLGRTAGRLAGSAYVTGKKAIKRRSEP